MPCFTKQCNFLALVLCGISFRGPEPWLEPTLTSLKRGGKGYPARKWSAGKNAEYPQNVSYIYSVIPEKNTCVMSAKDASTKDYVIDLNYQRNVLPFLFNTFTKKTWKHSSSTDFSMRRHLKKTQKGAKTLFCTPLQNYMWNMQLLLIVSNCSVWSDTSVQCREWTASRFSWMSNFVCLLFGSQMVYILNLPFLSSKKDHTKISCIQNNPQ